MRVFGIPNPAFLPAVNESSVVTNGLVTCIDVENPKSLSSMINISYDNAPGPISNLAYSTGAPIDAQQLGTVGTGYYYITVYAYKLASDNTTKLFSSGVSGYFYYIFSTSTYFTHYVSFTGATGADGYYVYVTTDTPYGSNYDFFIGSTNTSFYVDYGNVYADDPYFTYITTYGNISPSLISTFSSGYNLVLDLTSNKKNWEIPTYGKYTTEKKGVVNLTPNSSSYIINTEPLNNFFGTSDAVSVAMWYNPKAQGQILSELGQPIIDSGWKDAQIDMDDSGSAGSGSFYLMTWPGLYDPDVRYTNPVPYNKWYHLAFAHTGTKFYAYLNGSLIGTSSFNRSSPYNNGYDLYYAIAALNATNPGTINTAHSSGSLGTFYLYNRALSSDEIFQNYNSTKNRFLL